MSLRAQRAAFLGAALVAAAGCDASTALPAAAEGTLLLVATSADVEGGTRARVELLTAHADRWELEVLEDPQSAVFHRARCEDGDPTHLVTAGGTRAALVSWRREAGRWRSAEIYRPGGSGRSTRVRDFERGAITLPDGSTSEAIVAGTHDLGEVVVVVPGQTETRTTELDRTANTLVHEIELGDVDGDGTLEVYATRSPPNTLVAGIEQPGVVVRYEPATGRTMQLLDLAPRHAKEILATDLDGDGRDELYVVVEALLGADASGRASIVEPVEILRLGASDPPGGTRIATLPDRQTRSLVACDLDANGADELVAGAFSSGLWRIVPRAGRESVIEPIDASSGGFEHAVLCVDLDLDGRDDLVVADDASGELRRYTQRGDGFERAVIHRRAPGTAITWNIDVCRAPERGRP